jgi:SHS2 domain-containing protein
MPFEYLDHTADVALRGIGETIEEAFCEAAKAMFNLMVDLAQVAPKQPHKIAHDAEKLDLLLVEWLSELLAHKDLTGLFHSRFSADIVKKNDGFHLEGTAWGEPLDISKHSVKLEVKGVTYSGLHVTQEGGRWIAQCVVDI